MSWSDYHHINPESIDSLCPGIFTVQLSVLREYLAIRQTDIDQLAAALAAHDGKGQREYAHKMKSQFRLLGAEHLAELCQQLEVPQSQAVGQEQFAEMQQQERHVATEVRRLIGQLAPLAGE